MIRPGRRVSSVGAAVASLIVLDLRVVVVVECNIDEEKLRMIGRIPSTDRMVNPVSIHFAKAPRGKPRTAILRGLIFELLIFPFFFFGEEEESKITLGEYDDDDDLFVVGFCFCVFDLIGLGVTTDAVAGFLAFPALFLAEGFFGSSSSS